MVEPRYQGRYTLQRRLIQLALLAAFLLLPLFDLLRFDFSSSRLHLFRQEVWLDEWTLLWLFAMFGMWLVGAVSLVFGRVYCAYACPQMVFSELAHDIDTLAAGLARRLPPPRREQLSRAFSLVLVGLMSVAASIFLMGYFAPLPEVLEQLSRLAVGPWVGLVGATMALISFLDFAFVRERFCQSACPYGLLQGIVEDGRSLHVALDETPGACIDCGACERACPMAIDIRQGAFQIECTRCGSCIDSCDRVLARLGRQSVLGFRFEVNPGQPAFDIKRVLVGASTLTFGVALLWAVASRQPLSIHVAPLFQTAAATTSEEHAEAHYLLRAGNRSRAPLTLKVSAEGLPAGAAIVGLPQRPLPPGQEQRFTVVVRLPRAQLEASVTPFVWVFEAEEHSERVRATFYARRGSAS